MAVRCPFGADGLPGGLGRLLACDGLTELATRVYKPTTEAVGISGARPHDLRHAFASLLIHEGKKSIVEIAGQLGHNPTVCLDTYGHVMRELAGAERISAEEQISSRARSAQIGSGRAADADVKHC